MRTIQHNHFEVFLIGREFYKNYENEKVLENLIDFIDTHSMTYWSIACGLFDHFVDNMASLDFHLDLEYITECYTFRFHNLNEIINKIMKKIRRGEWN